jgi:hypothetical protein
MDIGRIVEIGEVSVRRPEEGPAKPEQRPGVAPDPLPSPPQAPVKVRQRVQRSAIAPTVTRSK